MTVIASVLTAGAGALGIILSDSGIPEFSDMQRRVNEELDKESASDDFGIFGPAEGSSSARQFSSFHRPTTLSTSSFAASSWSAPAPTSSRATTPEGRRISFSPDRRFLNPEVRSSQAADTDRQLDDYVAQYTQLLDNVISAGEEGDLPTNFGFAASQFASSAAVAIDPDTVFGTRSQDMMAHDMRIGAAGELYVRCTLNLDLPQLSR